jgi:hypothetical protein
MRAVFQAFRAAAVSPMELTATLATPATGGLLQSTRRHSPGTGT